MMTALGTTEAIIIMERTIKRAVVYIKALALNRIKKAVGSEVEVDLYLEDKLKRRVSLFWIYF